MSTEDFSEAGRQQPPGGGATHLRVGGFRVLEILGKGGMGTVYLAEQTDPVQRRVALKVLSGRTNKQFVARMEAERQALALMNHPSIATVFQAGTTDDGMPYFAMEVVEGQPLVEYCDTENLTLRARLDLFLQICDAVQHAHQKMIIHRDLKPSNVLVTRKEGRPIPKLIDFGIAKCMGEPLTDNASLKTHDGVPVGTPLYMSPEQIEGNLMDLDARVDVYALGMLLYELVVGVQPLDVTGADAVQAMLRMLREDLPRPSTRFDDLPVAEKDEIAEQRRSDAGAVARALRGDLDWIIMRAIEKERVRRYGTVTELRADVERYLSNQPVHARPPSVSYQMGRWARRHRPTVIAGLFIVVAMILGTTVSTVSMVRAKQSRDDARAAEQRSNATVAYLRRVLGSVDPGIDGRQVRVVDLLTKASEMIDVDLADQPHVEAAVRKTIGLTLLELGVFEDSAQQLNRAAALQEDILGSEDPETLHTVNAVGRQLYKLGRYEESAAIHRRVYRKQREILGAEDSSTLWTMYNLAKALDKHGEWGEAEALYRENVGVRKRVLGAEHADTLVSVNSMALFLSCAGKAEEAERLQRSNLESLIRLAGADHPDTLRARANLVEILNRQGRHAEAERAATEALTALTAVLGREHPETLGAVAQLAVALHAQGSFEDAEALNRRVLGLRQVKLGAIHPDTLDTQVQLGLNLFFQGRVGEAMHQLEAAAAQADESLAKSSWRRAAICARFGECLSVMRRFEEAEAKLTASYMVLKRANPNEAERVAGSLVTLYQAWGRDTDADRYRQEMVKAS